MYRCFTRTWWKDASPEEWPNGLEPSAGRKTRLGPNLTTEAEARARCRAWNNTHTPGRYSRKAEYEDA